MRPARAYIAECLQLLATKHEANQQTEEDVSPVVDFLWHNAAARLRLSD